MKKTTVLVAAVTASLFALAPLSTHASELTKEVSPQVNTISSSGGLVISPLPDKNGGSFTPDAVQTAISRTNITATGGNFAVPAGYGWLKIWVNNTGSSALTVTVTKSATNATYINYTIPAGKQLVIPNNGKATGVGTHQINFSSGNGVLSGQYSIVMASTPGESQS